MSTMLEICESALAQRRSAHLPKLKELANTQRFECTDFAFRADMGDLDFIYTDCDTHASELAELYTYSETEDWALNLQSYKNYADVKGIERNWSHLTSFQQNVVFFELIENLESVDAKLRLDSARIILYILQGAYMDFASESSICIDGIKRADHRDASTVEYEEKILAEGILNAYKAYNAGIYQALCTMLMTELNDHWDTYPSFASRSSKSSSLSTSRSTSNADLHLPDSGDRKARKTATMVDNESLRVVLNSIYHILESIRRKDVFDHVIPSDELEFYSKQRENFLEELDNSIDRVGLPLVMVLFEMLPPFCQGSSPHYPIKKILLLIWKSLLAMLGGWDKLHEEKVVRRKRKILSDVEDTINIANSMKASSVNSTEIDQNSGAMKSKRPVHCANRLMHRQFACTDSLSSNGRDDEDAVDSVLAGGETLADYNSQGDDMFLAEKLCDELVDPGATNVLPIAKVSSTDEDCEYKPAKNFAGNISLQNVSKRWNPLLNASSCGDSTPVAQTPPPIDAIHRIGLTWKPKVREEDIDSFMQAERIKFFNYTLPVDITTTFGLPLPIQGSIEALRRHLHTSLCDLQIKNEKSLNRYLFSQRESYDEEHVSEHLYRLMLPNMSQYVIAILKVLLVAAPSSKAKSDTMNILSDLLTPETETSEVLLNSMNFESSMTNALEHNVRIAIDINRHKEIIVKAASSILILLLKHFRLNHVYQFEQLGQHLVFGNSIPLLLKFLDQNVVRYVQSKFELLPYNYPKAPLYYVRNGEEWPVLNVDNIEDSDSQSYYLWRNVFSMINLLRVLNKLTKWKHSRTMMLVVFKSAPMLKRSLRIKLGIFQLYALKLLKMQARYLGRQWRRSNMEIMSAIYSKVRHRLNDDWTYANEARSKSWDFQNEEALLKAAVEKFNSRRYSHLYPAFALEPGEPPSPGRNYLDSVDLREFEPVDNSYQSLLGKEHILSDHFKRNYSKWVDHEVMRRTIDWDQLLIGPGGFMAIQ